MPTAEKTVPSAVILCTEGAAVGLISLESSFESSFGFSSGFSFAFSSVVEADFFSLEALFPVPSLLFFD